MSMQKSHCGPTAEGGVAENQGHSARRLMGVNPDTTMRITVTADPEDARIGCHRRQLRQLPEAIHQGGSLWAQWFPSYKTGRKNDHERFVIKSDETQGVTGPEPEKKRVIPFVLQETE